jgi:hypothetical protein
LRVPCRDGYGVWHTGHQSLKKKVQKHIDLFRDPTGADTIDTLLFTDGLKRVVQTKKDASIFTGDGSRPQDSMIVSGRVAFDHVGRTIAQCYPKNCFNIFDRQIKLDKKSNVWHYVYTNKT